MKVGIHKLLIYFLLILGTLSIGCEFMDIENKRYRHKIESEIVGSYQIDPINSKLCSYGNVIANWEATFTSDKKFHFSSQLPFLIDSVGEWQYILRNGVAYLELDFRKGSVLQHALTDSNMIIIQYPQPKFGYEQVEEVVLSKKFD